MGKPIAPRPMNPISWPCCGTTLPPSTLPRHGRSAAVRDPGRAVPRRSRGRARRARSGRGRRRPRSRRCTGCAPRRVDDVRELSVDAIRDAARARAVHDRRDAVERRATARDRRTACAPAASRSARSTPRPTRATRWDEYGAIVGARFDGHPWTQTFVADVLDPAHPACAHLGADWRWHDEVYQFRDLRPDAQVLLRVRDGELDLTAPGARPPSFGYPLAWCFAEGDGPRVLDEPRPLPVRVGVAAVPPPSRRRSRLGARRARREPRAATSPTGRTGGSQLDRTVAARTPPRPTDDDRWRAETRARARRAARRASRAACRSSSRRPTRSTAATTRAPASCSTSRRRCRCPRISSCRTRAATRAPGPAVLAIHGHGPGQVAGVRDRRRWTGRRLRARARDARATSCSRPTCAASASAPTGCPTTSTTATGISCAPRWPASSRSNATSGTSRARSTCSRAHPLVDPAPDRGRRAVVRRDLHAVPRRARRARPRRGRLRLPVVVAAPRTPSRGTCAVRR